MNSVEGGYEYQGSAANRLWHKSALGRVISDESLFLTDAEMIFCHEHRNIEWPHENWMDECIKNNPKIIEEYTILESLRKPGNKILLHPNFTKFKFNEDEKTWGLRWPSDHHPRSQEPISEIRWFHSSDKLDIMDLYNWASKINHKERIAEVLIVDNELAVVTYRIQILNPKGNVKIPNKQDYEEIYKLSNIVILSNGNKFIPHEDHWKWENIGIPYPGGRIIDREMDEIISSINSIEFKSMSISASIKLDLINRGLHPRPGFKYGSKWRCYDTVLGEDHAPWLVVHPDSGPENWEEACLVSRLAAGVNKKWLYPIKENDIKILDINQLIWNYLSITRPPADSRWNNPVKR